MFTFSKLQSSFEEAFVIDNEGLVAYAGGPRERREPGLRPFDLT